MLQNEKNFIIDGLSDAFDEWNRINENTSRAKYYVIEDEEGNIYVDTAADHTTYTLDQFSYMIDDFKAQYSASPKGLATVRKLNDFMMKWSEKFS